MSVVDTVRPEHAETTDGNAVIKIALRAIVLSNVPSRSCYTDDMVAEMETSLRNHGQREAIHVRVNPGNHSQFMLIDGQTRFMAFQRLDPDGAILAVNHGEMSDHDAALFGFHQNKERNEPTPIDDALFYSNLLNTVYADCDGKQDKLAQEYGIDKGDLSRYLSLANAPAELLAIFKTAPALFKLRIASDVIQVCKVVSTDKGVAFANEVIAREMSVREARERAKRLMEGARPYKKSSRRMVERIGPIEFAANDGGIKMTFQNEVSPELQEQVIGHIREILRQHFADKASSGEEE